MPICPRCGKCLSSEQALTYHLNRKYKCGTWNCLKCKENFNTKFQLQMHEMQCMVSRVDDQLPSTQVLLKAYRTSPIVCVVLDDNQRVEMVSPQCVALLNVKGSELTGLDKQTCVKRLQSCEGAVLFQKDNLIFVKAN